MKTMKIFEPAMCCPTGVCGVGVDPELLRISTVLNTLKEKGIEVQRYNLTSAPMEFVNNKAIAEFLQKFGPDKLPVTMVEDVIVITGRYPSNEEFTGWLELSPDLLSASPCCCESATNDESSSCCCGGEEVVEESSCCCGGESEAKEAACCSGGDAVNENCCEETHSSDKSSGGCCCGGGSSC